MPGNGDTISSSISCSISSIREGISEDESTTVITSAYDVTMTLGHNGRSGHNRGQLITITPSHPLSADDLIDKQTKALTLTNITNHLTVTL